MQLHYTLSQAHTLNMTPQLKQSIHILQISSAELYEFIQEQSLNNPLLTLRWNHSDYTGMNYSSKKNYSANYTDATAYLRRAQETLEDSLLSQLRINDKGDGLTRIAQYMAGNLDDNGYLVNGLQDVCVSLGITMETAEKALKRLQSLDPAGVGARNLRECLLLQIKRDPQANHTAYRIVSDYLGELGKGKLKSLAKKLRLVDDEFEKALDYIRGLNPKPGLSFTEVHKSYILPDAIIQKNLNGEGYTIRMNDTLLPEISISSEYKSLMSKINDNDTQSYVRHNLQAARWLIRSLEQRKITLFRVIESILEEQYGYFERGVRYLKPLNLKTIAEKLDMHVSTISRATNNKYILTPHGTIELKYFFSNGLTTTDQSNCSSESIKARIKQIIENEDKENPLSDQKMMSLLLEEGIQISRRTVMKYRDEMNVMPSHLRYMKHIQPRREE